MTEGLIQGHETFQRRYFGEREYLSRLAHEGQKPKALYIGCSDSRVIPEYLTSSNFGDIFVVRNIANFVPDLAHADSSVGAAIDYAVAHLDVPDIIVCGHYGCGGVQAAMGDIEALRRPEPSLHEWLTGITYAARRPAQRGLTGEEGWRAAVEENVLEALENLITYQAVKARLDAGEVHIHGWIYDMYQSRISVFDEESGAFRPASEVLKET